MTFLPLLLSLALSPAYAPPPRAQVEPTLMQSWEWWKHQSEAAREALAPKLMLLIGKSESVVSLAVEALDNTGRYRALCSRSHGTYRSTALCKGLQYRLGERSALSVTLRGLYRRAGTQNAAARDAAALLVGLRKELVLDGRDAPASPQYILHGLYDQLEGCTGPLCRPGLMEGTELKSLLTAAADYMVKYGNDYEAAKARKVRQLGWRKTSI